jgi:hypothetical protein
MRIVLAAPRPATAPLARIGNSDLYGKDLSPTNAPSFSRYHLLNHHIGINHGARSNGRNSHTATALLKSP